MEDLATTAPAFALQVGHPTERSSNYAYRLAYRLYRRGCANGARAEPRGLEPDPAAAARLGPPIRPELGTAEVTMYRLDYRRYRRGAARGVHGEPSRLRVRREAAARADDDGARPTRSAAPLLSLIHISEPTRPY